MKNPFDDDPLHHNNLSDIFGKHSQPADPNPQDGFQSHDPAFQDNSPYHPFGSEWGANHPDPSAFDPLHADPQGHLGPSELEARISELDARISKFDPDYPSAPDPSDFDPVSADPQENLSLSELNARISKFDPDYPSAPDPSDFDPANADPSELDARISEVNARVSELDPDYPDTLFGFQKIRQINGKIGIQLTAESCHTGKGELLRFQPASHKHSEIVNICL